MSENNESWAIAELMGHVALAGRITKPGEYGGLWQIDIPEGDSFRTEFFGSQAVYRIRMVSEEIARAYAPRHEVIAYNAPIITREEHEIAMGRMREIIERLQSRALPAGRQTSELGKAESIPETVECGNCGVYRTVLRPGFVVEECENCGDDEYDYFSTDEIP